jgi:hypothetical protein
LIWRINRPKKAFDAGHSLFCCAACGHVYGVLEAEPAKATSTPRVRTSRLVPV